MKSILFPTDFSECSANALNWAIGFSEKFYARLLIHNSCHLPAFNQQIPFDGISEEQICKEADAQMEQFILKNKLKERNIQFDTTVSLGLASDEIVSLAKSKKSDIIIMGTKGASGIEKMLIGSNTSAVLENSFCPVIAVPENAKFAGLNKIIFATDYNDHDLEAINFLIKLATPFMSEIFIVHVSAITGTDTMEREKFSIFKDEVIKKTRYEKLFFQLAIGLNVENDLDTIIREQKGDMLAMAMRKRNIFSRLFSPSLTKRMSFHTQVPLLSFRTG